MDAGEFVGLGYVATMKNADPSVIAELRVVSQLACQIAWGTGLPEGVTPDDIAGWLRRTVSYGLDVVGWAWCDARDVSQAEVEAVAHADACVEYGIGRFVANTEENYNAHGNQKSHRYWMVDVYVEAFMDRLGELGAKPLALGLTTTPLFGSSMLLAQSERWVHMPQAFGASTVGQSCTHSQMWGWSASLMRPLVQTYANPDGTRQPAQPYLAESASWQVGVCPYTVEQAMDSEGVALLHQLEPATFRSPVDDPDDGGDDMATPIGSQDGVVAEYNALRDLDPSKTLLVKADGKWPGIETLTNVPLDKWKAWDKAQRRAQILVDDHDDAL